MADVQTSAPAGGQVATAQPASAPVSSPAPSPTPAAEGGEKVSSVDWNKERDEMSVFGNPERHSDLDAPFQPRPSASPDAPSPEGDRHAPGAEVTEGQPAGKEAAPGEKLPGDDLLEGLSVFDLPPGSEEPVVVTDGSQTAFEVLDTPEKIEKAINPDGKSTPEQRLQNAQSRLGLQGRALGDARKQNQAFQEQISTLAQHFQFQKTADGKIVASPSPSGLIALARMLPEEVLQKTLADQLGVKMVPLDWNGEGNQEQADLESAVNTVLPGGELSFDEKWAEIKAKPLLDTKLSKLLNDKAVERAVSEREKTAQRHLQTQAERQEAARDAQASEAFYKTAFEEVKKKYGADYEPHFKEPILKWIDYLTEHAPEMPREIRFRIAHGMAQLHTPNQKRSMSKFRDTVIEQTRNGVAKAMATGGVVHAAQPMYAEPPAEEDRRREAEHRKAEASRIEMEKAYK